MFRYTKNMTQKMLDVLPSVEELKAEVEKDLARLVAARAAEDISLPATAASGEPVVSGTRNVMDNLVSVYGRRIDPLAELLWYVFEEAEWLDRRGLPRGVYGNYRKYGIPVPHVVEFWNKKQID